MGFQPRIDHASSNKYSCAHTNCRKRVYRPVNPRPDGSFRRRAAILLGETEQVRLAVAAPRTILLNTVRQSLEGDEVGWRYQLGTLMYENTIADAA